MGLYSINLNPRITAAIYLEYNTDSSQNNKFDTLESDRGFRV
jgi:hypothetical protein